MIKQFGFYFDSARCTKCYACEIACLQWHGIEAGTFKLRKVEEVTAGTFPEVKRTFLSLSCHHCGKPPCALVCPSGAISKRTEDGIVLVDSQKCNGCQACLEACPFGIPQFDRNGLMHKCDMCLDRLEIGKKPICVDTCPTKALLWGTLNEISELALQKSVQKLASKNNID
jgi:anaerobic dimethyl sulfoxide reductase subunit B (iron-sulfur subunit)